MPAMTNPDDYYQRLAHGEEVSSLAYKGSNGKFYCPECGEECKLFRFDGNHYHCIECGERR